MIDVVLIKSDSIIYDSRVGKIVTSLSKRYSTVVLGWNREGISQEIIDKHSVDLKLFSLKAAYGRFTLLFYLPFFWIWVFFKLITIKPAIVHACDLDTMIPAYIYKKLFGKKLIFDVFDRYGMTYLHTSKILRSLADSLEEFLAQHSDVLIVTSQKFLTSFRRKPQRCAIILNCPQDHHIQKINQNPNLLTLVYTGNIDKYRGIERTVEAIKDLDGVQLVIAGRITDSVLFQQVTKLPNVKYHGLLRHADALSLEATADVMICLYDLVVPNYNLAIANKTFEAMMLGLPVITNIALELIDEVDCGIKVQYNDLTQIKSSITNLRDNEELRKKMGMNGRLAFEQKYNWDIMEQELFKIYDGFLNKKGA